MKRPDLIDTSVALWKSWVLRPVQQLYLGLNAQDRPVLYALLGVALLLGFFVGRRFARRATAGGADRTRGEGWLRLRWPRFQNSGELLVARRLRTQFPSPEYHLLNHVTLQMEDGTTQIDHILVSRYGVFVIETKDYTGWIFGSATNPRWTKVHYQFKASFQNPIHQNYRHVLAVRAQLDFLPPNTVHSLVVFCGDAEFKTDIPPGVVMLDEMGSWIRSHREPVMTPNRMQFCVGRLETARLALTAKTDVEHVASLRQRFGGEIE